MACIMLACSQLISDKVAPSIADKVFLAYAKSTFIEHFAMLLASLSHLTIELFFRPS